MTESFKTQLLTDLFTAYFGARKHKRNKLSQLQFEANYETNIIQLREDIINDKYTIGPSTCFLIADPVVREIFAADFRDRVVHHLLYNYLYPLYDKHFIYDSYSCRIGKGTHFGVKRIDHCIRSCSQNYTKDCYILKLDIKGFFMSIDKGILWKMMQKILRPAGTSFIKEEGNDVILNEVKDPRGYKNTGFFGRCALSEGPLYLQAILKLIHQIIFHDPTQNYRFVGSREHYKTLPADKSLFHCLPDVGLPIGNITSQLFANVYLDELDKYIKYALGCQYYGRYVDDFVVIYKDKDFLLSIIPQIKDFLTKKLKLTLHPKKIYLQHYSKGVQFLGSIIKPHRTYINQRTLGNRKKSIYKHNNNQIDAAKLFASTNSYLGLCKHHKSYTVSRNIWQTMDKSFHTKYGLVDYVCVKYQ